DACVTPDHGGAFLVFSFEGARSTAHIWVTVRLPDDFLVESFDRSPGDILTVSELERSPGIAGAALRLGSRECVTGLVGGEHQGDLSTLLATFGSDVGVPVFLTDADVRVSVLDGELTRVLLRARAASGQGERRDGGDGARHCDAATCLGFLRLHT